MSLTPGQAFRGGAALLVQSAARFFYVSLLLQTIAAVLPLIAGLPGATGRTLTLWVGAAFLLLLASQLINVAFVEGRWGSGEMLRRNRVMAETLDWPYYPDQVDRLLRSAETTWLRGLRNVRRPLLRERVQQAISDTGKPVLHEPEFDYAPSPGFLRLAHFTHDISMECRHRYDLISKFLKAILGAILFIIVVVLFLAASGFWAVQTNLLIASTSMTVLSWLLAVNVLGWIIQLERHKAALLSVERNLIALIESGRLADLRLTSRLEQGRARVLNTRQLQDVLTVMREVEECNLVLSRGFPLPSRIFS